MTVRRNTTCSSRDGMRLRTKKEIDDRESEGSAGHVGDRGPMIDLGRPRADGPKPDREVSSSTQDDREPRSPAAGVARPTRLSARRLPNIQPPDVRGATPCVAPLRSPRLRNALTYWGAPRRHGRPNCTGQIPSPPHPTGEPYRSSHRHPAKPQRSFLTPC